MKTELESFEEARRVVTSETSHQVQLAYKFQWFSQVSNARTQKQKLQRIKIVWHIQSFFAFSINIKCYHWLTILC